MAMRIELTKREGVELVTKDKFCKDNIKVELDANSRAALTAQNIRSGAKILDVEGVYETPTEKRSVELDLADGNQVVEASSGKAMASVVIMKPTTLQPENIKLGVRVAGVLGNHETDLTAELAEQDEFLSEIEALLDGTIVEPDEPETVSYMYPDFTTPDEYDIMDSQDSAPCPHGCGATFYTPMDYTMDFGMESEDDYLNYGKTAECPNCGQWIKFSFTADDYSFVAEEGSEEDVAGGEDSGDGSATLTVNFAEETEEEYYDEELGDYDWRMTYDPSAASGTYSIDDGDNISFSGTSRLVIENLSINSVVRVHISFISGGYTDEYDVTNAEGCSGETLCEDEGHEPWEEGADRCGEYGCKEGVKVTVTSTTASITVYEVYA